VPAFQHSQTLTPVARNARRAAAGSSWALAIAVVSSMTSCAATARSRSRAGRIGASDRPYAALRTASITAGPVAASTPPPTASTPMNANWDAPVNTSIDITQACTQLRPAATASTPKETPYTPTAIPIPAAPDSVRSRAAVAMPRR